MDRPEISTPPSAAGDAPPDDLELRIVDAVSEYEALVRSGATPELELFLARYADLAPGLRECIEALRFVDQALPLGIGRRNLAPPRRPATLGDFQILRRVGGGGMGDVYEAYQISLARRVALKVLPTSTSNNVHALKRFQQEAQAAALLQHPHITPVYSVGSVDKTYFYAMQFIDGLSIAELIQHLRLHRQLHRTSDHSTAADAQTPQTEPPEAAASTIVDEQASQQTVNDQENETRRSADPHPLMSCDPTSSEFFQTAACLIRHAAEALQHAHDNGIIHRDIKPSNLLIDFKGKAWVADFGLARLPDSNLTASSDVLGTVRYMSPEQASGRAVVLDGRTDVYSLGATLYELLTLQPLFEPDERRNLLRKAIETEPIAPRQHRPEIPRDLETIVRKALAKEIEQRYSTAAEFADDLERFLTMRPILAKPLTTREVLIKWIKRNTFWVAILAAVMLIGLLAALIASAVALNRISQANAKTLHANSELTKAVEEKDAALYRANIVLARNDWDNGTHDGARARLDAVSEKNRMWEWSYLDSISKAPTKRFDNSSIVDLATAVSPDGRLLLKYRPLQIKELLTIQSLPSWLDDKSSELQFRPESKGFQFLHNRGYTFSPNGDYIAAVDSEKLVSVLNAQTGELHRLFPAPHPIQGPLRVRDDGDVIAPLHVGEATEISDLGSGEKLAAILDKSPIRCWSPDGSLIYQDSGTITDLRSGKRLSKLNDIAREALQSAGCAFSPDNKFLVGGTKNGIRVIDCELGMERMHFAHGVAGKLIAFSPDAARLAAVGSDRSVRLYDLISGKPIAVSYAESAGILTLGFQADGTTLFTSSNVEQTLWNCLDLIEGDISVAHDPKTTWGETEFFSTKRSNDKLAIERRSLPDDSLLETIDLPDLEILDWEISPATMIAALRTHNQIHLRDLRSNQNIAEFPSYTAVKMRFSPDGKWLIVDSGYDDSTCTLARVVPNVEPIRLNHEGGHVQSFAFNCEGSCVFVGYQSGDVVAWNTSDGTKFWVSRIARQSVSDIAVDPAGHFAACARQDGGAQILDAENGNVVQRPSGHAGRISALAFHPRQPRLATTGEDMLIRIWDTHTWETLFQIPIQQTGSRLIFTPSGNVLLALHRGGLAAYGSRGPSDYTTQRRNWLYRSLAHAKQAKHHFSVKWTLEQLLKLEPDNALLAEQLSELREREPWLSPKSTTEPAQVPRIEDLSLQQMDRAYATAAEKTLAGDPTFAMRAAKHLVAQIDDKTSPFTASLAYRLYLFGPLDTDEWERMKPEFERQVKRYKNPLVENMMRGGLLLRTGRFDEALSYLQAASKIDADQKAQSSNWLLLSLTQARQGNLRAADFSYRRAMQWRASLTATDFSQVDYQIRLMFIVLAPEVEKSLRELRQAP
ncbi:MAG: protein kinase [Pirellulales bacterium]